MMNNSLKNRCKVQAGTVIEGKWHKQTYTILKELGYGANGIVYLAQFRKQYVALKMSDNGMSIISEVNVLKSFAKVQGSTLGPSLMDVDDWIRKDGTISFYVMEYLQGPDLLTFIKDKGHSWTGVLMIQLLKNLEILHENNWVFGDLKPENLIITGPPTRIRCIDVGGTTIQGRSIKEFTEFYDRGYWGLGSRKADCKYDLFAVAMIIINTAYPKRFHKEEGGLNQLKRKMRESKELVKYESVLLQALQGQFSSAKSMRDALLHINSSSMRKESRPMEANKAVRQAKININRQTYKKKKKKKGLIETILIVIIISLLYLLYILGELF